MRRFAAWSLLAVAYCASSAARVAQAAGEGDEPLLGPSLATLFNPQSAPTQKTMGLLQRSFLDLVEESQPKLQIALVIDGTDSMSGQLESVRQSLSAMMADLELYKENNISYQIIVYRDAGSPSGALQYPLDSAGHAFSADREAVGQAIQKVQAESGAPYFPELVDEGLHAALAELPWSTDADVSRWIFLFGDAPPFDESFDEPANKAGRRYGTGALVALAAEKNIRVNCILCTSDPEDREAYDKALGQTRQFMNSLSSKTGGLMLDLSYEDIRAAVQKAAPARAAEYQKIGYIRESDVEQVRRATDDADSIFSTGRRVRIAILPHLPLEQMAFDASNEAVQLATELRLRLKAIPGVEFKDSRMIQDRFRLVSNQGVTGDAMLQMLAAALNVDYIMWGSLTRTGGVVEASTALYDSAAGRRLARAQAATNPNVLVDQLGGLLADNLVNTNPAAIADQRLRAAFASVAQNQTQRDAMLVPVALGAARSDVLAGMESLEQALAYPAGAAEGAALLAEAQSALAQAVAADPDNPLAHFLLANALFNQARAHQQAGNIDEARRLMADFAQQLRDAYRLRAGRNDAALRTEIAADYALLVRGKPDEAIKLYQKLIDKADPVDAASARRGYWMLAGIYSGDWGVDPQFANAEETKRCLTEILALWPDSPEADFIRRALRWDETEGAAKFPHFPKQNRELAEMVDHSA